MLRDIGVRTKVRKTKQNSKLRGSGNVSKRKVLKYRKWIGAHVGIERWIEFSDKKAFPDETFRVAG